MEIKSVKHIDMEEEEDGECADFIYSFKTEREREHEQEERQREKQAPR